MQTAPRPGRPRSLEVDKAIVAATLDLLVEGGYSALTVEAVAARAGVGKTTLYRRWPSKELLIADALSSVNDELPPMPEHGSVRERIIAVLEHIRLRGPETFSGRVMPRMVAYARSHPELYAMYTERVLGPRRERFRGLLREGVASGELRADLDIDVAVTCLVAPMIYTSLVICSGERAPEGLSQKIVEIVLDGAARGTEGP